MKRFWLRVLNYLLMALFVVGGIVLVFAGAVRLHTMQKPDVVIGGIMILVGCCLFASLGLPSAGYGGLATRLGLGIGGSWGPNGPDKTQSSETIETREGPVVVPGHLQGMQTSLDDD